MGANKEVVPIEIPDQAMTVIQPMTMPQVIQYAIQNNAGVEQLEKMMALQERYEANEARKAYHVAMTAFKANPPEIEKDVHVEYDTSKGKTQYNHASLNNVTDKINKGLSKHGLSVSWLQSQAEGRLKITCRITHILGHSEETSLEAAGDDSGGKNKIQAIGSTNKYLQRYTILSITGLATSEMDDDGAGSEAEYIDEEQIEKFNLDIEKKDIDLGMFLDYMQAGTLDKILAKDIKKAEHAIKTAKGKK